jgi:ferrous iron transport protein A
LSNSAVPNKSLALARLGETYVISVVEHDQADSGLNLVQHLHDLDFIVGEKVTMINAGPFGGDPVVVRVGESTYALRLAEAACIKLEPQKIVASNFLG